MWLCLKYYLPSEFIHIPVSLLCLKTFLGNAFTAIIQEIFSIRNMEMSYRINFVQYYEWSSSNTHSLSRKHFTESGMEWSVTVTQNPLAIGLAFLSLANLL